MHKYLKFYNPQTPWFKSLKRRPEWEKRTGMVFITDVQILLTSRTVADNRAYFIDTFNLFDSEPLNTLNNFLGTLVG